MPAKEQQDQTLSEYVVREAVEKGMDTPLREVIVEAVEESEGKSSGGRTLPLAGALVGVGAAAGYLLGSRGTELESEDISLESVEEPEIIDEVTGDSEEITDVMDGGESSEDESDGSSGSWLRRILMGVGIVAAIAFARSRMQSTEEEEWEPIEEFETAVSDEDEDEEEEAEAESEGEDEEEEQEEEAEAEADEEEEEEE